MRRSNFLLGSFIVMVSSVMVRVISFVYQIYLIRAIGAEGMGIFYIIMPVFMVALTITNSGLPTATSRIVSKYQAKNEYYYIRKIFNTVFYFVLLLSFIVCILMLTLSEQLSVFMLSSDRYQILFIMLTPAILFVSLNSLLRSLLYGLNKMVKSSISELIENVTRLLSVIILATLLGSGVGEDLILLAILGIFIGDFFAFVYLYKQYKSTFPDKYEILNKPYNRLKTLKYMIVSSIPLTLISFTRIISQFITAKNLPSMLIKSGFTEVLATETFGRLMGMAMPIVFAPFLFTSAIVINLMPSISHQSELKNINSIKKDHRVANLIVLVITVPFTLIMFVFSEQLSLLLFKDILASDMMKYLSLSTVFLSLNHISFAVLYGLQKGKIATLNRTISTIVLLGSIFILVPKPNFNIYGFIIGFITSSIITFVLDQVYLLYTKNRLSRL